MANAHIRGETLDDVLHEVIESILAHGVRIHPTKGEALEFSGVLLEILNPRARLSRTETRGKAFSALGELCWYLAGTADADFISYYIPPYRDVADDGVIYGGYGLRLFNWDGLNQVKSLTEMLRRKPDSRRAVVQLFDRADLAAGKHDVPCTCTLQFLVRENKLQLLTNMRSNDVHWGLPHDVFCFTSLQEIMARSLGVELGSYKHIVGSLHLYTKDTGPAKRFLREGWQSTAPVMPEMPEGDPWTSIRRLLVAEAELRMTGKIDTANLSELPPYWADLVRLLHVFRLKQDGNLPEMRRVREQMSNDVYAPFIDGLIRKLTSVKPSG